MLILLVSKRLPFSQPENIYAILSCFVEVEFLNDPPQCDKQREGSIARKMWRLKTKPTYLKSFEVFFMQTAHKPNNKMNVSSETELGNVLSLSNSNYTQRLLFLYLFKACIVKNAVGT